MNHSFQKKEYFPGDNIVMTIFILEFAYNHYHYQYTPSITISTQQNLSWVMPIANYASDMENKNCNLYSNFQESASKSHRNYKFSS